MDRNTTIAFVIIGLILIIWLYLNSPAPPPPQKGKDNDTTLVQKEKQPEGKKENVDTTKKKEVVTNNIKNKKVNEDTLSYGKYFLRGTEKPVDIRIENNKSVILLSTRGANIQRCYLKDYNNWYSPHKKQGENIYESKVQLINYAIGGSYNLSFITSDGKAVNTGNLDFTTDAKKYNYKISGNDSLSISFTYNSGNDRKIIKKYIFYGNKYAVKSDIEFVNMSQIISNNAFDLVWGNGIRFTEENSVDEAGNANASAFYGGEQVTVDASSNGEKVQKDFSGRVDWIAVRNKYFAAVVAPLNPEVVQGAFIEGTRKQLKNNGVYETYSARLILPFNGTALEKESFLIYMGPIDYDILKSYGHKFEAVVDFGSFFGLKFLIRPISEYILLPLFTFLHSFIPNYGIVIIVFSLIIKFVLYPLTKSSFQSMKKMQMLQPKIAELKEKYKDDAQKLNKETMKLYSTYGVNPAGGCLPLLLQMPIFVALWGLFRIAIELRQQPFFLWIKDLSQPDVIFDLGFKFPIFGIQKISGLAVLMGVTTFFQQKMSVKDPKQQGLVYIMPIFLTLMFMSFPSGLNLYYFMFNVFSIAQQMYINRKHDGMELQPVKKSNQKKGFMARMMEAAEQNAKTQKQKRRR
jgi:YidC/Oxa1 family membrane protein insertase